MPFQNMSIKKILKGIHEINTFSFPEFVFVELSSENSKLYFVVGDFHVERSAPFSVLAGSSECCIPAQG